MESEDTWYLIHSLSSWRLEAPEPVVDMEGSGETSLGGVGGKLKRGLECPGTRDEEDAGGYTARGPGLWVFEKEGRFHGDAAWVPPMLLLL